jgi:hypothetical protein
VLVKLQVLLHQPVRIHMILLSQLGKKKLPEQNVVHHVITDAQSDVKQLQQQQALQQVIDRIRKLNTAAAGTGAKKSRQSLRRHPVNSGSSSRSGRGFAYAT